MPKVRVEKTIKADRAKVFNTVTDFENLPAKLPSYFKSMKIVSREGNSVVMEESCSMGGRDITQTAKHILTPPDRHEVFIIDGDAKDSHIVETYNSTGDGTTITIEGDFKLGGKLKLIGFLAGGKIKNSIEEVMNEFAKIMEH